MEATRLVEFSERLNHVKNPENFIGICKEICQIVGFEYFLFGLCGHSQSLNDPDILVLTNYPSAWMAIYSESQYIQQDPVVTYAKTHSAPISWSRLMQMNGFDNPLFDETMAAARKFGLVHGLTAPVKTPAGEFGLFCLGGDLGDDADAICDNALANISFLTGYILEAVLRIRRLNSVGEAQAIREKLSVKEYECLFWACEGKTAWEISTILKLSERTVLYHLSNVTEKLGAANRQHAVAKAVLLGVVEPKMILKDKHFSFQ